MPWLGPVKCPERAPVTPGPTYSPSSLPAPRPPLAIHRALATLARAHCSSCKLVCLQDYFVFCTFSLALQIAAFTTFLVKSKQDADDKADAFERVIDLFVAAWPSLAPAVILFAMGVRMARLNAAGISTLQPDKLDAAAHTEVVCFDKTGTLTANLVSFSRHLAD